MLAIVCVCVCVFCCVCPSVCACVPLCVCRSVCLCACVTLCACVPLCVGPSMCVPLCVGPSMCVCVALHVCVCVFVTLHNYWSSSCQGLCFCNLLQWNTAFHFTITITELNKRCVVTWCRVAWCIVIAVSTDLVHSYVKGEVHPFVNYIGWKGCTWFLL